jgi:hypothetical protein
MTAAPVALGWSKMSRNMSGPIMAAGLPVGVRSIAIAAGSTAAIYLFLVVLLRIHGDVSLPAGLASAATLLVLNRILTFTSLRARAYRSAGECQEAILEADGTVSVLPRTKPASP